MTHASPTLYSQTFIGKLNEVKNYAQKANENTLWTSESALLKLNEEVGEVSEALLVETGLMPHKKLSEDSYSEAIDVILCLLDVFRDAPINVQFNPQNHLKIGVRTRQSYFLEVSYRLIYELITEQLAILNLSNEEKEAFWRNKDRLERTQSLFDKTIFTLSLLAEKEDDPLSGMNVVDKKLSKWVLADNTRETSTN